MKTKRVPEFVLAGITASLFLACGGPAAQHAGEIIRDAGQFMVDAGAHLLVDAGDTVRDAGRALKDSGASFGGDASAQPSASAPNGRWVLRDKSGKAIDAMVYEQPAAGALPREPFSVAPYSCVGVSYYGQRSIAVSYELATGDATKCYQNARPGTTWAASTISTRRAPALHTISV